MESKAMPVWLGLERLDSVAEQVKAGTWVQPYYEQPLATKYTWTEFGMEMSATIDITKPSIDYDALSNSLKGLKL